MNRSIWRSVGPGILFAGAAIGTSHLVQSTRAGAIYGLGLVLVVILANVIKYPGFRFGPFYAAATGKTLIEGYRALGKRFVIALAIMMLPVQIIIVAATAVTTAALATAILDLGFDVRVLSCLLLFFGVGIILRGGFAILTKITKGFVVLLTIATLVATGLALPSINWDFTPIDLLSADIKTIGFVLALCGFMPSALDLSVCYSVWSVEDQRRKGSRTPISEAMLDFNIGYISTAVLALCFVFMGAGVMHGSGEVPASSAGAFASQVIGIYSHNLGVFGGWIIGIAAFGVMFTTLITIIDVFPRVQAVFLITITGQHKASESTLDKTPLLFSTTAITTVMACTVILFFLTSFTAFIDMVTITAFLVAPVIATFNHIVVYHCDVPRHLNPSKMLKVWSMSAVVIMTLISLYFLNLRFFE